MDFFIIENNIVKPTADILMVNPFDKIWERDSSKMKDRAHKDLAYINYYCSPMKTNPYKGYSDEERGKRIISGSLGGDYEPDDLVFEAINWVKEEYLKNASFSYSFLQAAIEGANKLKQFFRDYDLNERTRSGTPVYKPADITRALKDTEDILKNIQSLEKRVNEELTTKGKHKGERKINPFEV
jgi:hypothetical protein